MLELTPARIKPPEPNGPPEPIPRFALRAKEAAAALGFALRTFQRLVASGQFPRPDAKVGRISLWRPATIEAWLDQQAKGRGRGQ